MPRSNVAGARNATRRRETTPTRAALADKLADMAMDSLRRSQRLARMARKLPGIARRAHPFQRPVALVAARPGARRLGIRWRLRFACPIVPQLHRSSFGGCPRFAAKARDSFCLRAP